MCFYGKIFGTQPPPPPQKKGHVFKVGAPVYNL